MQEGVEENEDHQRVCVEDTHNILEKPAKSTYSNNAMFTEKARTLLVFKLAHCSNKASIASAPLYKMRFYIIVAWSLVLSFIHVACKLLARRVLVLLKEVLLCSYVV